jgi:hypothetical protein
MALPLLSRGHLLGVLAFIASAGSRRYGQRDLRLAEAEWWNDPVRVERARSEASAIESQLLGAIARGGRSRRAAQAGERARIAVKRRLDDAVRRIGGAAAPLGEHLERAVRTGLYCSYLPDRARRRPR